MCIEIKVIILSASANKLGNLKSQAGYYASMIMEELDPDHLGYIEVTILSSRNLFRQIVKTTLKLVVIIYSNFSMVKN